MALAYYPNQIVNFGADVVDFTDTVLAAHMNSLRAEVTQIESTIGIAPTTSTTPSSSGSWVPGGSFATLTARLANIEQGLVGDSHTQYLKRTGGTMTGTLTFSGAGITGLPTPTNPSDAASKSYVDSVANAGGLSTTGGTMTGNITFASGKVTGLPTPTAGSDAANKNYVDAVALSPLMLMG